MKPLIVDLVITVKCAVRIYEEEPLLDGYTSLQEAVQGAVADMLDRRSNAFGELDMTIEAVDYYKVREFGDFAEMTNCPLCGLPYVASEDVQYIMEHGACHGCPDPELEELE
jgi:hypothetical protein